MTSLESANYAGRSLLGRPGKSTQSHPRHRRPSALAPALVGVAAVTCLAAPVLAGAPAMAATTAKPAAAAPAPNQWADLVAATGKHVVRQPQTQKSGLLATYTVKSGDSLSAIAGRFYHNPDAWPVLYWANHHHIRWANSIQIGQQLRIPVKPAKIPSPPSALGPAAPAPAPVRASTAPAPAAAPAAVQAPVTQAAPAATYSGGSSFQQCVIARESGGNSQVMNSSGHYGLYQFSESTWVAYGGSAASFGNASVAEQNQVFANAMAAGGQSNWAPYDGC